MPPKDLKAEKRRVETLKKVAEDKTFGLKNKNKSKKVQQYVASTLKSAADSSRELAKAQKAQAEAKLAREEKKKAAEAVSALLEGVIVQPKLKPGQDPKSVLCEFFRHGKCKKGENCRYSHDWGVEVVRKGPKIDLFTDQRDDGMENWDQETLERAVAEKHGAEAGKPNKTKIICKFFLDAVEKRQYGWFWKCPNGEACIYRHALPPGYVLKSEMQQMLAEEKANQVDISDTLEAERQKVDAKTPITEAVFREWRRGKVEERRARLDKERAERLRAGRLTGKEIFESDGFVAEDDDAAGGGDDYQREIDWEAEERAVKEAAARALDEARGAISSLGLDDQEAEELFGGDDDDDDDEGDGDGVDGEDDGDGDGPSEQGA